MVVGFAETIRLFGFVNKGAPYDIPPCGSSASASMWPSRESAIAVDRAVLRISFHEETAEIGMWEYISSAFSFHHLGLKDPGGRGLQSAEHYRSMERTRTDKP